MTESFLLEEDQNLPPRDVGDGFLPLRQTRWVCSCGEAGPPSTGSFSTWAMMDIHIHRHVLNGDTVRTETGDAGMVRYSPEHPGGVSELEAVCRWMAGQLK